MSLFETGNVVLFQGDSITDCGRNRGLAEANHPDGLGRGYVFMAGGLLRSRQAGLGLRVHNRGISGDRIIDLHKRWQQDCLDLKPAVLSLLVGVNDWAKFHRPNLEGVATDIFGSTYRELLANTRKALPAVRLILGEPFVLQPEWITDAMREDLAVRQAMVRTLARDFDAVFVPYQAAFEAGCRAAPPRYWSEDGVHPSHAGHSLMARAWLAAVGERV